MYKTRKTVGRGTNNGAAYITKKIPKHIPTPQQKKDASRRMLLQRSPNCMILKAEFERLVRELGGKAKKGLRRNPKAIDSLHYGSQDYLQELFENVNAAVEHCGGKTTKPKDLALVQEVTKK